MHEILTDTESLRTISTPVTVADEQISDDVQKIIRALVASMPDDASGLSAPQINFFKRTFIGNFPDLGMYVFINPIITKSSGQSASTEGCLSLPECERCILRSSEVTISADIIYKINTEYKDKSETIPYFDDLVAVVSEFDKLSGLNAAIVQHEIDHLEGILIIDYAEYVSRSEEVTKRLQDRHQRVHTKRQIRKVKTEESVKQKVTKPNPKREAKIKKQQKSANKRKRKQIAAEELRKAIESGTISSD